MVAKDRGGQTASVTGNCLSYLFCLLVLEFFFFSLRGYYVIAPSFWLPAAVDPCRYRLPFRRTGTVCGCRHTNSGVSTQRCCHCWWYYPQTEPGTYHKRPAGSQTLRCCRSRSSTPTLAPSWSGSVHSPQASSPQEHT